MKKAVFFIFIFLLIFSSSAMAMLRILEPEASLELQEIAKVHLAETRRIDLSSITVEDTWLREFSALGIDVYTINTNFNGERASVAVQVDTKAILTAEEVETLAGQDLAAMPAEGQIRTTMETDTEVPLTEPAPVEAPPATNAENLYTMIFLGVLSVFAGLLIFWISKGKKSA